MRRIAAFMVIIGLMTLPMVMAQEKTTEHEPGKGAIKGLVFNLQGMPVPKVKIEFSIDSGASLTVETNETGEFFLENVPPGEYSVKVSKEGYKTFHDRLKVEPDVLTTYKVTIVTEAEAKEVRGGETWKQAQEAFKKGNFAEAETLFQKVTEMDPNYGNAYFNLGITQARLGKCEEALQNLQRAYQLHYEPKGRTLLTYYFAEATCYEKLGQLEKAEEPYKKLVEIAPQQFTLLLGNLYLKMKAYDKARETFEQFLRISPNAPEAPQVRKVLQKLKEVEKNQGRP